MVGCKTSVMSLAQVEVLGYSVSGGEQGSLDSARGVYGDGWSMTQIEGAEGREPLFGGGGVMDTSRD